MNWIRFGHELRAEWDLLFSIFHHLQILLFEDPSSGNTSFASVFGALVTTISELSLNNNFLGNRTHLLQFFQETSQYQDSSTTLYVIGKKKKSELGFDL